MLTMMVNALGCQKRQMAPVIPHGLLKTTHQKELGKKEGKKANEVTITAYYEYVKKPTV